MFKSRFHTKKIFLFLKKNSLNSLRRVSRSRKRGFVESGVERLTKGCGVIIFYGTKILKKYVVRLPPGQRRNVPLLAIYGTKMCEKMWRGGWTLLY
jgi:hypothetical protein